MAEPGKPRTARSLGRDERAVSPAVAKTLEAGIVTLYVALVAAVLLGGTVPEYRAAAGEAVGERALVRAAHHVEDAVPATGRAVRVERSVELPATVHGRAYSIAADGRALVLEHPSSAVGKRVALAMPPSVVDVTGRWESASPSSVVVTGNATAWRVRLVDEQRPTAGEGRT